MFMRGLVPHGVPRECMYSRPFIDRTGSLNVVLNSSLPRLQFLAIKCMDGNDIFAARRRVSNE